MCDTIKFVILAFSDVFIISKLASKLFREAELSDFCQLA